jgi:hypothetical protein
MVTCKGFFDLGISNKKSRLPSFSGKQPANVW